MLDYEVPLNMIEGRTNHQIVALSYSLSHEIGKGEFGTVWEGEWSTDRDTRRVAIKTLNPNLSEKDRIRFLQEAVIIGQFRHPNIVRLLGVVKDGEPVSIVTFYYTTHMTHAKHNPSPIHTPTLHVHLHIIRYVESVTVKCDGECGIIVLQMGWCCRRVIGRVEVCIHVVHDTHRDTYTGRVSIPIANHNKDQSPTLLNATLIYCTYMEPLSLLFILHSSHLCLQTFNTMFCFCMSSCGMLKVPEVLNGVIDF